MKKIEIATYLLVGPLQLNQINFHRFVVVDCTHNRCPLIVVFNCNHDDITHSRMIFIELHNFAGSFANRSAIALMKPAGVVLVAIRMRKTLTYDPLKNRRRRQNCRPYETGAFDYTYDVSIVIRIMCGSLVDAKKKIEIQNGRRNY